MSHTASSTVVVPDLRVYKELDLLSEVIPARLRTIFCYRWGFAGYRPHLVRSTARWCLVPAKGANAALTQCLWNAARHAHEMELPVIRQMLGEDPAPWVERAWAQADRWGNPSSRAAETVLLLAVGGVDVPEARRIVRQYLVEVGVVIDNPPVLR